MKSNLKRSCTKTTRIFAVLLILLTAFVIPVMAQTPTPVPVDGPPVISSFLSSFVQELLLAFAPVVAGLIAAFLVAQIKIALAKLKTFRPDVYEQMIWVVGTAVKAAEQAGAAGLIKEKKSYALDYVQKWLAEKGWKIDVALIDSAIEAAVYEQINGPAANPAAQIGFSSPPVI